MNVTPTPASTAARTDSCEPELEPRVEVARPHADRAQLVLDRLAHAGALLHEDERLLAQVIERDRLAREAVTGRAGEHDLVAEQRLEHDRAVASREADDAELDRAVGDELDDRDACRRR